MKRQAALIVAAALVVAGCRDQDPEEFPVTAEREPYEELTTAADTAGALGADEGMSVITVQGGQLAGGAFTATGHLRSPGGGAPPGAVTLTEENGTTRILLTLHGYQAGSQLQAVIVQAPCGRPGPVAVEVEPPVTIPAEGVANLEARLDQPLAPYFEGRYSLRLLSADAAGAAEAGADAHACADFHSVGRSR